KANYQGLLVAAAPERKPSSAKEIEEQQHDDCAECCLPRAAGRSAPIVDRERAIAGCRRRADAKQWAVLTQCKQRARPSSSPAKWGHCRKEQISQLTPKRNFKSRQPARRRVWFISKSTTAL